MKYGNLWALTKTALTYPGITRSILYRQALYKAYSNFPKLQGRVRTRPAELVILLSRKCFLDCIMCGTKAMYGSDDRFSDFLDFSTVKAVADEISRWPSPVYVKLTGGEATMHPQFQEILEYFSQKGVPVRLSTNGVLLKNPELARTLVRTKTEVVTISVDGGPECHDRIRLPNKENRLYETILAGVEAINSEKKKRNSAYPMVQFTCTISTMNYEHLVEFARSLKNRPIQWLNFAILQYITEKNGKESERVIKSLGGVGDEKWRFFFDAPEKVKNMNMEILGRELAGVFNEDLPFPVSIANIGGISPAHLHRYYFTDDLIHTSLCANPYISAVILSPGLMCFCIDFPQFYYGDVRKESLEKIWFSATAQGFRRKFLNYFRQNGQNMPQCLRCGWRFW